MNSLLSRTPYNQLPIGLGYFSIDRKLYRDQFCLECGHPFMAISDKIMTISDGGVAIEFLREGDRIIQARCRHHYCKQYYNLFI